LEIFKKAKKIFWNLYLQRKTEKDTFFFEKEVEKDTSNEENNSCRPYVIEPSGRNRHPLDP
jgi:hypothetical protein